MCPGIDFQSAIKIFVLLYFKALLATAASRHGRLHSRLTSRGAELFEVKESTDQGYSRSLLANFAQLLSGDISFSLLI